MTLTEKQKQKIKWLEICALFLLIFFIVILAVNLGGASNNSKINGNVTDDQQLVNKITKTLAPYQDVIGNIYLENPKSGSAIYEKYGKDAKTLTIKTSARLQQTPMSSLISGNFYASKIFEEVFLEYPNIQIIKIDVFITRTDDYGNNYETLLVTESMNRAVYNKINWAGFDSNNLYKVLDAANQAGDTENNYSQKIFVN